ncbi:hypothetical protein [Roseiterribacter gracilis]|uniref:Uncharacterized protein n=1 Tax=Roseiterribacter gracilis TaxID=2812848 RepID=A0A8S8X6Y2_9PROT|nr:hypothetical protein TMPK1_01610 [Rhodospirillales bacterium TMPK1]
MRFRGLNPGRVFLLLAMTWFAGSFYVLRPDLDAPTNVVLWPEDGKRHRLYSVRELLGDQTGAKFAPFVEPPEYSFNEFFERPLLKFVSVALLPPLVAVIVSVTWVSWAARRP